MIKQNFRDLCLGSFAICRKNLLGLEVAPSKRAVIRDIPETADLGRVGTGSHVNIGDVDTVDRHTVIVPVIHICTQIARLPAVDTSAVPGEGGCDGGCWGAGACAATGGCDGGC